MRRCQGWESNKKIIGKETDKRENVGAHEERI